MKKIYLIQPGQVLSGEVFLPYSIGTLAAYAWQFDDIKKEYDLGDYVFLKEPIDEVIGNMVVALPAKATNPMRSFSNVSISLLNIIFALSKREG